MSSTSAPAPDAPSRECGGHRIDDALFDNLLAALAFADTHGLHLPEIRRVAAMLADLRARPGETAIRRLYAAAVDLRSAVE